MVSNIYNAYLPNMVRPAQRGTGQPGRRIGEEDMEEGQHRHHPHGVAEQGAQHPSRGLTEASEGGVQGQQPSRHLATVADQSRQNRIQLGSILKDFESTMDALGTDEPVRGEVNAYLGVVAIQADKPNPSVPFIRQTLKTAADSLDGYIAGALGQPSRVVRDWVEALLLQNIDYRNPQGATRLSAAGVAGGAAPVVADTTSTVPTTKPTSQTPEPTATSAVGVHKQAVKSLVESGREALKSGNVRAAIESFEDARAAIDANGQPEAAAKLAALTGRAYQQAQDWTGAQNAYQQAATLFGQTGNVAQQGKALGALAAVAERSGDKTLAATAYQQAVDTLRPLGSSVQLAEVLNDAGVFHLQNQNPKAAEATLKESATVVGSLQGQERLASDVWSNLGAMYRLNRQYPAGARAYKHSMALAKAAGDDMAFTQSLTNLADLYIEGGKPEKARALFGV